MTIEQRIQDAIMDVRQSPDELEEIAAEYGIKPEVLRARIEKSFGSVEAMIAADAKIKNAAERDAAERAAAKSSNLAAAIARLEADYIISRDHEMKGIKFFYEGDEYVFILLSRSHPKYFAQCIRLSDATRVGFNRTAYNELIVAAYNRRKEVA